jgi:large repetitive protein
MPHGWVRPAEGASGVHICPNLLPCPEQPTRGTSRVATAPQHGQAAYPDAGRSSGAGGTFAIISGSLSPGLSMPSSYGASGTIVAGTPTRQGTFTFTVKGTDQQGQPLQQAYSITVGPAPPLTIVLPASGATLSRGQVGVAYTQNFFLSGGVAPYTWSVASGQLPPGLALKTTAGPSDNNQLAGTATTAGTFTFTMKLTDGSGQQATQQFSLTI